MHLALSELTLVTVLTAPRPSAKQQLAASELRRGLFQLTSALPTRVAELPGSTPLTSELRVVLLAGNSTQETYEISTSEASGLLPTITVHGAGEQALLYGVFELLERQGAVFGIDGDSYPLERPHRLVLPEPDQPWRASPRFATRGLLPWPDFLNCISVYNREDWRAYLEAMLRMRFNTLGVHVYGQRDKWAESFLSFEYGGVGHAAFTDTTATDRWGNLPQRTSRYGMGAAQYFDGEVFGADATRFARSPWEAAERAQAMWREAFSYAEQLGIRTGVGFEPYQLPDEILRATPPEVRIERSYELPFGKRHFHGVDPESRTARRILETRLNRLLEAYPSVAHVYLWEDEIVNWASQRGQAELPVTPFRQAHDFLRRHAPDKRLVLAGWGGVVRNFEAFHRVLPEDVIFSCLNDQFGWDPIHEVFSKLEGRERWPIPWIEDDPAMWFPQFHVGRFASDLALAEQYGCQGVLGIHWRHRIVDPVATYQARRSWDADLEPAAHYQQYAHTQAAGDRAVALGNLLARIDGERSLLSTWTGEKSPDGHALYKDFAGDYGEAFTVESGHQIPERLLAAQLEVIHELEQLLQQATTPRERERLGYLHGQIGFLDPYARAWRAGVELHTLIKDQVARCERGEQELAHIDIGERGIALWIALLGYVREAVLAFQHTVSTRNDLGMLASLHNKLVRIATFRLRESLLEFLDPLPDGAQQALDDALAPDNQLAATVIVPTRPTRLRPGEAIEITAIAPGALETVGAELLWRRIGARAWEREAMQCAGRRTYTYRLTMPPDVDLGIEFCVEATFAASPEPLRVRAPQPGGMAGYVVTT